MAPPFKQAEFDILYGIGIRARGRLLTTAWSRGWDGERPPLPHQQPRHRDGARGEDIDEAWRSMDRNEEPARSRRLVTPAVERCWYWCALPVPVPVPGNAGASAAVLVTAMPEADCRVCFAAAACRVSLSSSNGRLRFLPPRRAGPAPVEDRKDLAEVIQLRGALKQRAWGDSPSSWCGACGRCRAQHGDAESCWEQRHRPGLRH
ncbi:hypothetical protein FQA39_LY18728 [Lamprigera yunnana]|nr:hypothetical protein FQA39_LY18728 [Lamprigera yunnana]